jgi:hypothetical protein
MSGKPYKLIGETLPEVPRVVRGSIYDELLDSFVKGKGKTARVEYSGKSAKNLMSGIRARIKRRKLGVNLAMRRGRLYLVKP